MKDGLIGLDEKIAEQNVPHDVAIFDSDEGHDHRSISPQAVNKLRFSFSLERCVIQLPHGIVVPGDLFTDKSHSDFKFNAWCAYSNFPPTSSASVSRIRVGASPIAVPAYLSVHTIARGRRIPSRRQIGR